jgi:mRNA-degrading endonuclease toxin of MazEF toxin-antitoxin module
VDRDRLVKRLGTLDAAAMRKIDQALKISLELVDL